MLERFKFFWSGLNVQLKIVFVLGVFVNLVFFWYFLGFGGYFYSFYQAPAYPYGEGGLVDTEGKATYRWEGKISAENSYNGSEGRHRWTGEYDVKFLEVPGSSSVPGRALSQSFYVNHFVPLELKYTIKADQSWDRGAYAPRYNAGGELISGDVRYTGVASGRVTAADGLNVRNLRYLLGSIVRLDAPFSQSSDSHPSLASYEEYSKYLENVFSPFEQGWYDISIGFVGWAAENESGLDTPKRQREMYRGIDRTGLEPVSGDPNLDFLHWMPPFMPDGMHAVGRLDSPDQREVEGSYSFSMQGPGGLDDREIITIEWRFMRIPLDSSSDSDTGSGAPRAGQGVEGADLELRTISAPKSGAAKERLTYVFEVENHGGAKAIGVMLGVVTSDSGGISIQPEKGECDTSGSTPYCILGDFERGDVVRFEVRVSPQAVGESTMQISLGSQTPDPNYLNNVAEVKTAVR